MNKVLRLITFVVMFKIWRASGASPATALPHQHACPDHRTANPDEKDSMVTQRVKPRCLDETSEKRHISCDFRSRFPIFVIHCVSGGARGEWSFLHRRRMPREKSRRNKLSK